MRFITINDLNEICFKDDGINIITDTDKPISDEIYNMFFEQQSVGKQFRIKDINGTTFEEIFEEYIPEIKESEPSELDLLKARIEELEKIIISLTN